MSPVAGTGGTAFGSPGSVTTSNPDLPFRLREINIQEAAFFTAVVGVVQWMGQVSDVGHLDAAASRARRVARAGPGRRKTGDAERLSGRSGSPDNSAPRSARTRTGTGCRASARPRPRWGYPSANRSEIPTSKAKYDCWNGISPELSVMPPAQPWQVRQVSGGPGRLLMPCRLQRDPRCRFSTFAKSYDFSSIKKLFTLPKLIKFSAPHVSNISDAFYLSLSFASVHA